jgi:hypothetical protein
MRWFVILVSISVLTAAACGGDGVTSPSPRVPISTTQLPPSPELTLTIPSITVSRDNNRSSGQEWLYLPEVLISETSGRNGAHVISWGAGPADGPPITYDSSEGWCGDPRLVTDPAVSNLVLDVPPGGTLDLSRALRSLGCSPSISSTDPESSVVVAVRFRDDQGRTIEAAGSIAVP